VPHYRIYFIGQDGHVSKPPAIVECADDEEAIQKTKQFLDGQDIELWDGRDLSCGFPVTRKIDERKVAYPV
jgi:hypothetical protein